MVVLREVMILLTCLSGFNYIACNLIKCDNFFNICSKQRDFATSSRLDIVFNLWISRTHCSYFSDTILKFAEFISI